MSLLKSGLVAFALLATGNITTIAVHAQEASNKTVVLVHGAWANSSSWDRVIPLLDEAGLKVVAVSNPLASLKGDVANTNRVIDDQTGPVVLVGHSYGGVVITEAGNNDKVKALVYVAAFAPQPGQSVNAILAPFGKPEWFDKLHADAQGFTDWPEDAMAQYFAAGLPQEEIKVLAATQTPIFAGINDQPIGDTAAYANKPAWSVVADQDQIIPAPLQLQFADTMKSTVAHVPAGHLVMLIAPEEVAKAIITAAEAVK
jgi:pimeloyl-ACP methyl ester carboxylesterase